MSRVARALVRDGIVVEHVDEVAGIGRPRKILSLEPAARHVVGVKLTGDTAYAVACNLVGDVLASATAPLPPPVGEVVPVAQTVTVTTRLIRRLAKQIPVLHGVCVAVGGVVDDRTVVREGTFLGWRDVDFGHLLRDRLGVDVVLSNDVTALAREELWFGAGRTHATFGVMTVGAGLGFAVVREGVVLERLLDNGHLLGHAPINAAGPPCELGHRGCVSAYLNRSDVERRLQRLGVRQSLREAIDQAEPLTADVIEDAARALAHVIATFAGALQTDRIVLAGEDVQPLFDSPVVAATLADRLRRDAGAGQECELDVSTAPLTFVDWARGAAVTGVQQTLGAL